MRSVLCVEANSNELLSMFSNDTDLCTYSSHPSNTCKMSTLHFCHIDMYLWLSVVDLV